MSAGFITSQGASPKLYRFTWDNTSASSAAVPAQESTVSMFVPNGTKRITVQAKTNASTNSSVAVDINVISGSFDQNAGAIRWDLTPYDSTLANINATIKTVPITVGPEYLKIQIDNNDSGSATDIEAIVTLFGE